MGTWARVFLAPGLSFLLCAEAGLWLLGSRSCGRLVGEQPLSVPVLLNDVTVDGWVLRGPGATRRWVSYPLEDCGYQNHPGLSGHS